MRLSFTRPPIDADALRRALLPLDSPPLQKNQELAFQALNQTLDRMLSAKERLDTKAAVVPAVVAAIATAASSRIELGSPPAPLQIYLVAFAATGAAVSSLLALGALAASEHPVGPGPADLVTRSHNDARDYRQLVLIALAVAAVKASEVVYRKGARFNLAIASAAYSLVALLALGLAGGLH
jgi:hypothetical protein